MLGQARQWTGTHRFLLGVDPRLWLRNQGSCIPSEAVVCFYCGFATTWSQSLLLFAFSFVSRPLKISASLLLHCLFSVSHVQDNAREKFGVVSPHHCGWSPLDFFMPGQMRDDWAWEPVWAKKELGQPSMAKIIELDATQKWPLLWKYHSELLFSERGCDHVRYLLSMQVKFPEFLQCDKIQHSSRIHEQISLRGSTRLEIL